MSRLGRQQAPAVSCRVPRRVLRRDGLGVVTTTGRVQPTTDVPATPPEHSAVKPVENPDFTQTPDPPGRSAEHTSALPPQLAKILGGVVAPTTLLTALLYYFGWSHAYWFCNYFGVNSTVLGFTTTDYLMRSVDALFVPMTVAASGALLAVWCHTLLRARLAACPRAGGSGGGRGSRPRRILERLHHDGAQRTPRGRPAEPGLRRVAGRIRQPR